MDKHVIILYDDAAYSDYVFDMDKDDVFVGCTEFTCTMFK